MTANVLALRKSDLTLVEMVRSRRKSNGNIVLKDRIIISTPLVSFVVFFLTPFFLEFRPEHFSTLIEETHSSSELRR